MIILAENKFIILALWLKSSSKVPKKGTLSGDQIKMVKKKKHVI